MVDCSRISGLCVGRSFAPGHDESRTRGANRCQRLLRAGPVNGL